MKWYGGTSSVRTWTVLTVITGLIAGLLVAVTTVALDDNAPFARAAGPIVDDFNSGGYSGGSPELPASDGWTSDWVDSEDSSAGSGRIQVSSNQLRFANLDTATLTRNVDLSSFAATGAKVSLTLVDGDFDSGNNDIAEDLELRFWNGSSYEDVAVVGQSPDGTRLSYLLPSNVLIASGRVQFGAPTGSWSNSVADVILIDDFEIEEAVSNNDLVPACGIDVELIIDESGSIESESAVGETEDAIEALVTGLTGTGSRMRLVEFSTNGRDVELGGPLGTTGTGTTAEQDVDAGFLSDVQAYLGGTGGTGNIKTYSPGDTTGDNLNFTNWEAAWEKARPNDADLYVFITDGVPNTVGTNNTSADNNNGDGGDNSAAAAVKWIDAVKSAGKTALGIGVGQITASQTNRDRLGNLIEPNGYQAWTGFANDGALDLRTTDVIEVEDFADLDDALRQLVFALCAPSLSITKVDQDGNPIANWQFESTVEITENGEDADDFEWVTPLPGGTAGSPDNLGQTKTDTTSAGGTALFQWTPNTVDDPEIWTSQATFSEVLPTDAWGVSDTSTCSVDRLLNDGTTSTFDIDVEASDPDNNGKVTFTLEEANSSTAFDIQKADLVKCTIVNEEPASITIVKETDPQQANDGQDFGFSTTSPSVAAGLPASFDLDDDNNNTLPNSETFIVSAGDGYTVTEDDVSGIFWELEGIECVQNEGSPSSQVNGATVTIDVGAGEAITCTFTNEEAPAPQVVVDKTASPISFVEPAGSVQYTVKVTNPNGAADPLTITALTDSITLNGGTAQVVDLFTAANGTTVPGGSFTANDCATLQNAEVGDNEVSCTFTIAYSDRNSGDDLDDTVEVTAKDDFDREVKDDDPAEVDVTPDQPSIQVTKNNVEPITLVAPGGLATYEVIVENTSANEAITLTGVTDQLLVDAAGNPVSFANFGDAIDITTVDGTIITASTCTNLVNTVLEPDGDPDDSYTCEFTVDTAEVPNGGALAQDEDLRNFVEVTGQDDDPTPTVVKDDDVADRPVLGEPPSIGVFKTDNGAEIDEPGEQITYDVDIFNLGTTEALTITKIVDAVKFNGVDEGTLTIEDNPVGLPIEVTNTFPGPQGAAFVSTTCDAEIGTVLAPATGITNGRPDNADATTSCQIVLDLPGDAGDEYSDIVTVNAVDASGDPVEGENSAETPVVDVKPAIQIVKTANPTSVPETGAEVTFTLDITNTSSASTDPLTLTELTDTIYGNLFDAGNTEITDFADCVALDGAVLAQGASTSCDFKAVVAGDFGGPDHVNVASVKGVDDEQNEATDDDDATVTFTDVLPQIQVTKTADKTIVDESGEVVTYTIVVTNTGPETVDLTSLDDDKFGDITSVQGEITGTTCVLTQDLEPGEDTECTFTVFLAQQDAETSHTNVVTAKAEDDDGNEATDDDPETVEFRLIPPTVDITKTDNGASVDEPGGTVTYDLTIANTSDEDVTITTLTDTITYEIPANVVGPINLLLENPGAPVVDGTNTCHLDTSLAADDGQAGGDDETSCSFDVVLTGTSQTVSDVVNVVVIDNDNQTDDDEARETTPIEDVPPTVNIVKTANPTLIEPGQDVTYTFVISNPSEIEPLTLVQLTDDKFGDITTECGLDGLAITLDPNDNAAGGDDEYTCDITRAPQPGLGDDPSDFDHINVATITAGDDEIINSQGGDNPLPYVTDDDDAKVEVREPGSITIDKVATPAGQEFNFTLDGGDQRSTQPTQGSDDYPEIVYGDLDEGSYAVAEIIPDGWVLTGVECTLDDQTTTVTPNGGSITIDLEWGDDVSCVFTNAELGDVSVDKTVTSSPALVSGNTYTVTYGVEVATKSNVTESFVLEDVLNFGAGTGIVSATPSKTSANGPDPSGTWNGVGDIVLTSGDIEPGQTLTYQVVVQFTVDAATTAAARDCAQDDTEGTGTLNTATVTWRDNEQSSEACEPIPDPAITVEKDVATGPTYNSGTGVWTITYDVVATNAGPGPGTFDMSDTTTFGAGTTITTISAASSDFAVNGDFDASGEDIVNDEPLNAGE
ncbi:MAG: hypothetical protein AAFY28_04595, partial [Actinomycetota bacterium]